GGPRVVSAAYLALVEEREVAGEGGARWQNVYDYLPWEDWREGKPPLLERVVAPALAAWAREGGKRARRDRVELTCGVGAPWDGERTLERYELLYEAGLVREAWADRGEEPAERHPEDAPGKHPESIPGKPVQLGRPMALDHRRILATALGRVRG